MACSLVSHAKVLHNHFISCLYLRKINGNFRKSLEIFGISENFGTVQNRFWGVFTIFENFESIRKSSENLRMWSELFCSFETFAGIKKHRSWYGGVFKRTPAYLLLAGNGVKVALNTTRCKLSVAYRRICNGFPRFRLAEFSLAWDTMQRNAVSYNMPSGCRVK